MKKPRRLLVRGVNWLGDAVMSIPALIRLREALPETHITLLTAEKLADLWRGHAALDAVLPFTKQQGVGQVSRMLREGGFDASLILPSSFRSAFECWLAAIPVRVGYGRRYLLSHSVKPRAEHVRMRKKSAAEIKRLVEKFPGGNRETFPASAHHLHQYLRLTHFFGASESPLAPAIQISAPEKSGFATRFLLRGAGPIIGLNPGAEYGPAKRWPSANFVDAAREVSRMRDVEWLIFGGPGDKAAAAEIQNGIQGWGGTVLNLAGQTNLRELAAGLSLCEAVLTNDTGPMHLAAAVGCRVIVPFGSTSPELTGPGLPGDHRHALLLGNVPCAPCFLRVCPIDHRCMKAIRPSDVAGAIIAGTDPKTPQ